MRLSCLMFLAVISVVTLTECKPLSDDVEKAPCVDCKQKNLRSKRSYHMIITQATVDSVMDTLNLGCISCYQTMLQDTLKFLHQNVPVNRSPDIFIGNGKSNVNHVIVNGANNVYIGNGEHNTNYVSHG